MQLADDLQRDSFFALAHLEEHRSAVRVKGVNPGKDPENARRPRLEDLLMNPSVLSAIWKDLMQNMLGAHN